MGIVLVKDYMGKEPIIAFSPYNPPERIIRGELFI